MAASTRATVFSRTPGRRLTTRSTVASETPASRATSSSVTLSPIALMEASYFSI